MENTFPSDDDSLLLTHEDVLIQIIVWLPAKSLLRFKSVSKSWRALIESSFFIHLHATSSYSNRFGTFIFETSHYDYPYNATKPTEFFMLSASSSRSDDGDEVIEVEDLELPPLSNIVVPSTRRHKLFMVGSCNGIVCLYDSSLGDVSLWNPATRQFRLLPMSLSLEEDINRGLHEFVGFGFDVKTKDYKVVKIMFCEDYIYILGVQVYSLSTDSWRLLEGGGRSGLNPLFTKQVQEMNMDHGLYFNGSYFFEGINHQDDQIGHSMLSFDFTQEIFTTMQFPDECDPKSTLIAITTYLGEKIALFTKIESSSSTQGDPADDYDIWVLNEHHGSSGSLNKESCWTKLQQHSIQIKRRNDITSQTTIPRGISNDGEFAFIETRNSCYGLKSSKLQLFNLVTKEASIEVLMGKELNRADVYKPSLVSINGGNGATTANRVISGAM